jgi:hypothetical protein
MKKLLIAIMVMGLLPITSAPAEAQVCTYKRYQVKNTKDRAYTFYEYKTKRICKGR